MNYNYLHYFSVLAKVEHYTLAASRLGISQPSLSSAIHNLENNLGGVKLFEKVGRNIRLTEQGRYFQQKVDVALEELYSASRTLMASKDGAPIVINLGFVSGTLQGNLAKEIQEYAQQNKRIRFKLTESSAGDLMDMVRQEQLDMAIVDSYDRDPSLHFLKLRQRDFYIAFPKDHPLANSVSVSPHDIIPLPQVVFNYDVSNSFREWASGTPTDENVVCTVNTIQSALDLVAAGVGIAFIPDECLQDHPDIQYVPLRNWHQALYICILYDKWLEPLVWKFREKVCEAIRKPINK